MRRLFDRLAPWILGLVIGRWPHRVVETNREVSRRAKDDPHWPSGAFCARCGGHTRRDAETGACQDCMFEDGVVGEAPPESAHISREEWLERPAAVIADTRRRTSARRIAAVAFLALSVASVSAGQTQPDPFHLVPATTSGGGGGGSGTVESVGLAAPADLFTVSNSPVTTTGTLTLTKATAAANTCYAGPVSGGAAAPTFRPLVAADIPDPLTSSTSGNAGTASAAASNPGNCSAGNLPRGVSATWTAEGCAPVNLATESTGAAPTATALAVDPANCGAGLLPRGVDAGGVAQGCAAVNLATESTGPAPTATALAANGTNCAATEAAIGVDASGNAEGCFTPAGGVAGTGTDNHAMRWDGPSGAQDSALVIADVAGSSLSVATTPGNALALAATAPSATTGASQAGKDVTLTASNATASTDTAGAAAGGSVLITSGNAARNASGDAVGGDIVLQTGAGIGAQSPGRVLIKTSSVGGSSPIEFWTGGLMRWAIHGSSGNFMPGNANYSAMLAYAVASATVPGHTFYLDDNTGVGRAAEDQLSLIAGGSEVARAVAGTLTINDTVKLTPRASPPVTCGSANTQGTLYNDDSVALCWCDGTAWQKLSGGGTCA